MLNKEYISSLVPMQVPTQLHPSQESENFPKKEPLNDFSGKVLDLLANDEIKCHYQELQTVSEKLLALIEQERVKCPPHSTQYYEALGSNENAWNYKFRWFLINHPLIQSHYQKILSLTPTGLHPILTRKLFDDVIYELIGSQKSSSPTMYHGNFMIPAKIQELESFLHDLPNLNNARFIECTYFWEKLSTEQWNRTKIHGQRKFGSLCPMFTKRKSALGWNRFSMIVQLADRNHRENRSKHTNSFQYSCYVIKEMKDNAKTFNI